MPEIQSNGPEYRANGNESKTNVIETRSILPLFGVREVGESSNGFQEQKNSGVDLLKLKLELALYQVYDRNFLDSFVVKILLGIFDKRKKRENYVNCEDCTKVVMNVTVQNNNIHDSIWMVVYFILR